MTIQALRPRSASGGGRRRLSIAVSLLLLGSAAALTIWRGLPNRTGSTSAPTADDIARLFCAAVPTDARIGREIEVSHRANVVVPDIHPAPGSDTSSVAARKGEAVELLVYSRFPGAVGVHGLSDIEPIHPGEPVAVRFRAIYSGRFPLHFHGIDSSHFELLVIDVR